MIGALLPLLAADDTVTRLRWRALPELWLIALVIVPAVALLVWSIYRSERGRATRGGKLALAAVRIVLILLVIGMLFEPYAEISNQKTVRAHLILLLDTSASLDFTDRYADEELATRLAEAAGVAGGANEVREWTRAQLVKGVLGNRSLGVLARLREKFVLHVYAFDRELRPIWSEHESAEAEAGGGRAGPEGRIDQLDFTGNLSAVGDALDRVIEEFRLRDEPVAGVLLVTDGRRHGGTIDPLDAARKTRTLTPPVDIHPIIVGDPAEPRNVNVSNLRAKEVVLLGDDVTFELTIRSTGFEGRVVPLALERIEDNDVVESYDLDVAEVALGRDDAPVEVTASHRFERAGSYLLRIGVPVQAGEQVTNDNTVTHPLRVIDKRIKVLFIEGGHGPRFEYKFLASALVRDTTTMEAQAYLAGHFGPPFTAGTLPIEELPADRKELFEYDVVIFGDVDWQNDLASSPEEAERFLENLRAFVEAGGGLAILTGPKNRPTEYLGTPLEKVYPVVASLEEYLRVEQSRTDSYNLRLTATGRAHPIMQIHDDPEITRQLWEDEAFSRFFWYFPALRAKTGAEVLAVHSGPENLNAFGRHPIFVTMLYGRGHVFWSAIDETWRLRYIEEDRYHYRFWSEVVRSLATYKLLSGNRRFKIFTRDQYHVNDDVRIEASVLDENYEPATAETQRVLLRLPGGDELDVELQRIGDRPGSYERVIRATREGAYHVFAPDFGSDGDRPEKAFRVIYSTDEKRDPLPDRAALTEIGRLAGGRPVRSLADLPALPDEIPARSLQVPTDIRPDDLWDGPIPLLLIAGLLTAEWLFRKRYQML